MFIINIAAIFVYSLELYYIKDFPNKSVIKGFTKLLSSAKIIFNIKDKNIKNKMGLPFGN